MFGLSDVKHLTAGQSILAQIFRHPHPRAKRIMDSAQLSLPQGASPTRLPVSAIILTFNEELNVERCLESIRDWCDEIHVVDSGSTDATLEICARYTSKILHHPYVDSASQWEWALSNALVGSPWVLVLDADHRVTPELWGEIRREMSASNSDIAGYYSRHQYFFWGKPVRGFKPYGLRLFRTGRVTMDHSELVDMRFMVDGMTRVLSGYVYEHNMKESSIDFWIDKHQQFATRMAAEEILRAYGRKSWTVSPSLWGNPDERIAWLKNIWFNSPLYLRSILYFAYRYVFRLGLLDGTTGAIFHFLHALWFRLLVDIKVATIRENLAAGRISLDDLERAGANATG